MFAVAALWVLGLSIVTIVLFFPAHFGKLLNLTSVGSNLNLTSELKSKITIEGNYRTSPDQVILVLIKISSEHGGLNFVNNDLPKNLSEEIKSKLPWVKHIILRRSLPDKLIVTIVEYEPFAIWRDGNNSYIIDRDGNKIPEKNLDEFKNLIVLFGKNANLHAKSLLNIMTIDSSLSANIDSASWVSDRRWNIKLNNGTLIKLPASNLNQAWQRLVQLYRDRGISSDLDLIDLRVEGKMYIESRPLPRAAPTSF